MSSCNGRGDCIQQCGCMCYDDEEYEVPSEVCICGHRNHKQLTGGQNTAYEYCKKYVCPYNCQLVECHNFKICGKKYPQHLLDCHNGMCTDCAIMIGRVKFLDKKKNAPFVWKTKT
jgi:hypothetical protein